jgi:RHH-type proline utilization regulon transcriptional repressor/proline dehydrogenase/delta 1-pyrroline-5-carboxylate dehydrogenase
VGEKYSTHHVSAENLQKIYSSSDSSVLVGEIDFATKDDALKAIDTVDKSYQEGSWSKMFWLTRCSILLKAADIMLNRRNELSALISYEAGKSIIEAYGDVDEAIDFLTYYAREERKITVHSNKMVSRGPIAAITPWNFPLAIPTGMVAGPLVAGNPVILKSAEQTPLIASKLVDIFYEAGVPKDALIYLPGLGEEVGQALVESPKIAGYVFTGSKAVGQMIGHKVATRFYENKLWNMKFPVKAVTELGGKNAIIITANAELDETVAGILYSAFAHAGQKCSAASRIIVDDSVKDRLIERLKEAVNDIEVSEAFKFSCSVNPVISLEDRDRLREQVQQASTEAFNNGGKVVIDRSSEDLPGLCVGPAILDVPKKLAMDKNSFATKELFGPVIHIIGFNGGLDEALDIFHGPDYALTGGVFSQSQDDIDYLTSKMECGNLYVNRSITGARVGIEPFGGFKLSGTGPKAGGKVYIPAFHIHRRRIECGHVTCEDGIHSSVELSGRSGLGPQMRVERVGLALESVINHFEMFFEGIRGPEKKLVSKFKKWISKNALDYMTKDHQNRKIPGQLSYSSFEIQGEHAVCIAGSEIPRVDVFLQVSAALLMGTGVTVLCRNQASYQWWCGVLNYFHNAGVSKENFNVSFPTKSAFDQALKHPLVNYYIVDGDEDWVKEINKVIFDESYSERRIRQVFTAYDSFNPTDFKRLCGNFVWVRAFAVNTMRHGAPLDLDLDVEV